VLNSSQGHQEILPLFSLCTLNVTHTPNRRALLVLINEHPPGPPTPYHSQFLMISALYPIRIKARERLFCIDLPPVFELRVTIPGCDGESQKGLLDRFQGLNCSEFVFAICYAPPIVLLAFTTLSAATNPLEFVVAAPQSLIPPVVSKTSSFFA
jgi:hypothetical protein